MKTRYKRIEMVVKAEMTKTIIDLVSEYTTELSIKDVAEIPASATLPKTRTHQGRGGERVPITEEEAKRRARTSGLCQEILRHKGEIGITQEFGNSEVVEWALKSGNNPNSASPSISVLIRAGYVIRVHPGIYRFAP